MANKIGRPLVEKVIARSRPITPERHAPTVPVRTRGRSSLLSRRLPLASAISAILAGAPIAHADTATATATEAEGSVLEEITVTAQKKAENLQNVPISIEVFDSRRLEQLNVVNLDDYVKYSPSVSY